ncbi:MAG: sulfatase-like hydrolase/transferase [Deltaproteobacteria bacterium]|nr:sulfatase-like hydrolase/transferase [Deltaproteobacteria bacterium]
MARLQSFFSNLKPLFIFYGLSIVLFTLFRAVLFFNSFDRINDVPHYLLIFPIGLRMDTIVVSYCLILPAAVLLALPAEFIKRAAGILALYFAVLAAIFCFMEIATFPFMAEFDTRPDRLFIEHMVQVREVFGMIFKGYLANLATGLAGMVLVGSAVFVIMRKNLRTANPSSFSKRLLLFIIVAPLLFIGLRSSFGSRPASIGTAAFSENHLANQLGISSIYSVAYAAVKLSESGKNSGELYGIMDKDELLHRIMAANGLRPQDCTNPDSPLLHQQLSSFTVAKPLNLVIILEESMGAEHVGCLGGLPLTPNIDRLSRQGILFKNLYCTGTRTIRGIEAIIAGILPTPAESVLKSGLAGKIFTIAGVLKNRGSSTAFFYGGKSTFDNMRACFRSNGFDTIYDQDDFKNPVFTGTWGVSDEDLFEKANEVFKSHGDKPFFALVLTTSNHDPYEFPDGRIELYEQPKATRFNNIKYADFALGKFFEVAQKEAYYKNTVFLVIADHSTRLRGRDLIPVEKFHIPALILAPHLPPLVIEKIVSQIDMTPTLLDIMGISADLPIIGRPILSLPEQVPGRAVLQYGTTHALMVGTTVIVQQPDKQPAQFIYSDADKRLHPAPLDPELAGDALAYSLLPDYLQRHKQTGFPDSAGQ